MRTDAAPAPLPGPDDISAIRKLRQQAFSNSLRSYAACIRDAVGWAAVAYFMFFLVAFLIDGLDRIPLQNPPLAPEPLTIAFTAGLILFLLILLLPNKMAPVTLNRQELHYLALAPVPEWQVVKRSFTRTWSLHALFGLAAGGMWLFLARRWFGITPWTAVPAAALLSALVPSLRWLSWLRRDRLNSWSRSRRWQIAGLAGCLIGLTGSSWGPIAPFYRASSPGIIWYLLLAAGATGDVYRSLAVRYPPSFRHHCHLRNQLRHLTLSRFLTGELYDPAVYRRLIRQIRGRSIRARPRFGFQPFPLSWGSVGVVAWRSANQLVRRPFWTQVKLVMLLLAGVSYSSSLSNDTISIVMGASMLGLLYAELLGPELRPAHIPIRPFQRTIGRVLPGFLITVITIGAMLTVAALFTGWLASATDVPLPFSSIDWGGTIFMAVTVMLLGLVGLEKISTLSRQSYRRVVVILAAGFTSILISLVPGPSGSAWVVGIFNLIAVILFLVLD